MGSDLGITYFHTDFKNKIAYSPLGYYYGNWFTRNENINAAITRGIELVANVPIMDYLNWNNNATYFFEAKNKDTGETLLSTPKLIINSALNWKPMNTFSLELVAQYQGKQYLTDTTLPNMQKRHTIVNLAANYDYSENLTFRGGLTNLLDKKLANCGSDYMVERQQVFAGLTYKYE
ncbi:MAG: TonB-dependent receptor [Methanobrevibacter sp.]|nr:TonB-dependent receptor [Methanobrevibacter sp.]